MATKKTAKKVKTTAAPKKAGLKAMPPKQDAKLRRKLDQQIATLLCEVKTFLNGQSPELILAKQWFHDGSVAVPSRELLAYAAHEMLLGSNRITCAEAAGFAGIDAAFSCFIDLTRKIDDVSLRTTIEHAVASLTLISWTGGDARSHWWLCRWVGFQHEKPIRTLGAQRIAQSMTETLIARALFMADWKDIQELAEVTKCAQQGDPGFQRPAAMDVALLIFKWHRHLQTKLGRAPSREELKKFILAVEGATRTSNDAWNDGFRLIQLPFAGPRSIRADSWDIEKLANAAKRTGPVKPETSPKQEGHVVPEWARLRQDA